MRDISQQKDYIAVSQPYRTEYTIEKSRFIASIAPCQSEAEAQAFITSTKKRILGCPPQLYSLCYRTTPRTTAVLR